MSHIPSCRIHCLLLFSLHQTSNQSPLLLTAPWLLILHFPLSQFYCSILLTQFFSCFSPFLTLQKYWNYLINLIKIFFTFFFFCLCANLALAFYLLSVHLSSSNHFPSIYFTKEFIEHLWAPRTALSIGEKKIDNKYPSSQRSSCENVDMYAVCVVNNFSVVQVL